MASFTWDGQANSNWSNALNWANNFVPAAGDEVLIDNAGVPQPILDVASAALLSTTVTAGTLTVDNTLTSTTVSVGTTGTLTVNAGRQVVGALLLSNGGTVNNNGTIDGNAPISGGTFNNAGAVTGATGISAGILNLNAGSNLSDTRALTVNGGLVNVNASDSVGVLFGGGGQIDVDAGRTFGIFGASNGTYAGNISGAGTLSKAGAGTQTLTGANAHSGTLSVTQGVLQITGAGTIGSQTVITGASGSVLVDGGALSGSAFLQNNGTFTVNGAETIGQFTNNGTVTLSSILTLTGFSTLGGTISGAGGVTVSSGTTNLTAALTYSGATTVSGGTLNVTGAGALASSSISVSGGGMTVDDSALAAAAAVTLSGSGSLTVTGANSIATLSQSGSSTIAGAGVLTLSGGFTQTGGTMAGTVNAAGVKTLQGGLISGTLGGAGASTIQTGTTTVSGTINGDVSVSASGTLRLAGANAVGGTISSAGGTISYANGQTEDSGISLLTPGTRLEVLGTDSATQSGVISDAGGSFGFEKVGDGNLILPGYSFYLGATTISAGTLTIANSFALGHFFQSGTTVANGATLASQGGFGSNESITLNGEGVNGGGALRNVSQNNSFDGSVILGSASRINSDAGSLRLGFSSITGAFDLTFGGSGAVSVTNEGIDTGTGSVIKDGNGVLAFSGMNSYTGTTTVNAGKLDVSGGSALSDTAHLIVNAGASVSFFESETVGGLTGAGGVLVASPFEVLTIALSTGSLTYSGVMSSVTFNSSSLIKTGAGNQILSGANTYFGWTQVSGGTLTAANGTALGSTVVGTTVFSDATLALTGGITVAAEAIGLHGMGQGGGGALRSVSGNNTLTGAITLGSAARINTDADQFNITGGITGAFDLTVGGAGTTNIASAIDTGAGGLIKDGTGLLILGTANGFTGATTVNGGSLQVLATGALSATGLLTVNAPGSVQFLVDETVGNITGGGGILLAAAGLTLTAGDATNQSFAGAMGQIGAYAANFTKAGSGALTLSGASTYTGTTTVNGGTLSVTGGLASALVTVNAGASLQVDGTALANTATVNLNGAANLTLTGSETIGALAAPLAGATVTLAGNVLTLAAQTGSLGPVEFIGSAGVDRLNIALASGQTQLSLAGASFTTWSADDRVTLTGNSLANTLIGDAGTTVLNGGLGNDTMIGGAGNDTYVVDSTLDRVFETTTTTSGIDAGGVDTVQSSVTLNLNGYAGVQFVERLVLTGTANINGTGNALANRLTGNAGNNVLNGGLGNDTMTGDAGNDTFIFNTALGVGNIDRITDFNVLDDTIRLDDAIFAGLATGTLAPSAFAANLTGKATTPSDRIIYETDTGRLYFDSDGVGGTARVQFATLSAGLALANTDFVVF